MKTIYMTLVALGLGTASGWAADEADYTRMLEPLRTELAAKLPDTAKTDQVEAFLASDALDAKLAKCVVLLDATPGGLAEFAQQGKEQAALVGKLLSDPELMQRMLVADGAKDGKYGRAMQRSTPPSARPATRPRAACSSGLRWRSPSNTLPRSHRTTRRHSPTLRTRSIR